MVKKYITKIEDLLALKDTDKKIYIDKNDEAYYQFIDGIFCQFENGNGRWWFNTGSVCSGDKLYTLEEDPIEEATEKDAGKLCEFWTDRGTKIIDTLNCVYSKNFNPYYARCNGNWWKHCRVLTEEDFKKIQNKEGK